ncbi:MAG: hypothetical protein P8H31_09155 [Porticoccaceae bacterium]|nr:hypothetical protein [Porticoccaceae bacterium]
MDIPKTTSIYSNSNLKAPLVTLLLRPLNKGEILGLKILANISPVQAGQAKDKEARSIHVYL